MGNEKMGDVANNAPTSMGELSDCNLPQNIIKQYGERLVKNISTYVSQQSLEKYIENRPKKKQKTEVDSKPGSNQPIVIDVPDSDNEFDDDIDFSAVPDPSSQKQGDQSKKVPAQKTAAKQSNPYDQKPAAKAPKPTAKSAAKAGSKLKSKKSHYF